MPALAVDALDLELHLLAQLLVERAERLIHQQQAPADRPSRARAPRAAAGRPRAGAGSGRQARRAQPARSASATRRSVSAACDAAHLQREGDVAAHASCAETARSAGTPCRCRAGKAAGDRPACRSERCEPASGCCSPATIISVVVLPEPDGPRNVRNSWRRSERSSDIDGDLRRRIACARARSSRTASGLVASRAASAPRSVPVPRGAAGHLEQQRQQREHEAERGDRRRWSDRNRPAGSTTSAPAPGERAPC